jgi:DHA2 family multidrug resistance protein
MIPTLIQGVAMAFFFIPLMTITLSGISPDRMPAASGLSNFVRITAGAFGTSIATTLWQDRAALHHAQLSEYVNAGSSATNSTLSGLAAGGFSPQQSLAMVDRLANQQAYMLAANDIFFASAVIFLAMIPLVYLTRHSKTKAHMSSNDAAASAH